MCTTETSSSPTKYLYDADEPQNTDTDDKNIIVFDNYDDLDLIESNDQNDDHLQLVEHISKDEQPYEVDETMQVAETVHSPYETLIEVEAPETQNKSEMLDEYQILHVKPIRTNKTSARRKPVAETSMPPKTMKVCVLCGNEYKFQHALDSHMRRHRNEKPFECEYVNILLWVVTRKSLLFFCFRHSICGKGFVINFELNRHKRTHTGQKPYACKFCDRRFSDFGSRIKHERTHTGERPYCCEICFKQFAYSHVLSAHMLTHTGEKRYE